MISGGPGRPILLLFFHDKPIAVAISVGDNGFVAGMNPRNFEEFRDEAGISLDLMNIPTWPPSCGGAVP